MSPSNHKSVELAERYADGLLSKAKLAAREKKCIMWEDVNAPDIEPEDRPPDYWCDHAAWKVTEGEDAVPDGGAAEVSLAISWLTRDREGECEDYPQIRMLRDIVGNPFRPVSLNPSWLTATVTRLAQAIYDNRELPSGLFDNQRMGVLADALEEAGCDNADILDHLRGGGEHVRGCWPIDLLLGKE
jgi:hypothetical protein